MNGIIVFLATLCLTQTPSTELHPVWREVEAKFQCRATFEIGKKKNSAQLFIAASDKGEKLEVSGSMKIGGDDFKPMKPLIYRLDKAGIPLNPSVNSREELYLFFLAISSIPIGLPDSKPTKVRWHYPGSKFEGICIKENLAGLAIRIRLKGKAVLGDTAGPYMSDAFYNPSTGLIIHGECELMVPGMPVWFTFTRV